MDNPSSTLLSASGSFDWVSCLNAPLQVGVLVGDGGFGDLEHVEYGKLFVIKMRDTCDRGLACARRNSMGLNTTQDRRRPLG